MNEKIKTLLSLLKENPGCYLMHDQFSNVIYVGKAKNLKARVSQYFLRPQVGKVKKMVNNISYFETIFTENEREAFILELNLIHKYLPKYNILLKDDKKYPYIALLKSGYPKLKISRSTKDKKYYYFGPFPVSKMAYGLIDLLNKIYPTIKCKNIPHKPCLYYHLNNCVAPCINKEINSAYLEKINQEIKDFLHGKTFKKEKELKLEMKTYSNEFKYEKALEIKELLDAISVLKQNQNVDLKRNISGDYFAYIVKDNYISLSLFIYRNGLLLGKDNFILEYYLSELETLSSIINQYYESKITKVGINIFNKALFDELYPLYKEDIKLIQSGKEHDILNVLLINAQKELDEYLLTRRLEDNKTYLLEELGNNLNISYPTYIELFDNSHISGTDAVGVSVAFINGVPNKKLYRKFNLNNDNTKDDLSNMKEVLKRKYTRSLKDKSKLPDLLLLDGGLNQINVATTVLNDLNINIPIFGLKKNDKHKTESLIDINNKEYLFTNKEIFFLLSSMQDEVHRFAISFHRNKRNKRIQISIFDNIEGLGLKRRNKLFEIYNNYEELKAASVNELSQILPLKVANDLYTKLHE